MGKLPQEKPAKWRNDSSSSRVGSLVVSPMTDCRVGRREVTFFQMGGSSESQKKESEKCSKGKK